MIRSYVWLALMASWEGLGYAEHLIGEAYEYIGSLRQKFDPHAPDRWRWYVEAFGP